jgi:hypothetical protein
VRHGENKGRLQALHKHIFVHTFITEREGNWGYSKVEVEMELEVRWESLTVGRKSKWDVDAESGSETWKWKVEVISGRIGV